MEFTVDKILGPNRVELSKTNKVIINPTHTFKYIKIKNYIYECQQDKNAQINTLGLNLKIRENLKLQENSKIILNEIDPSTLSFDDNQELLIYISKAIGEYETIDIIDIIESEFNDTFRNKLNNLIVNNNQKIIIDHNDATLICEIKCQFIHRINLNSNIILLKDTGTLKKFQINDIINDDTKLFKKNFDLASLGIGGLGEQFNVIMRRVFSSRMFSKSNLKKLGMNHVKGMLLYGPPGCGKTLLAKQIGKILNCKEPKIVTGPSLLNKYVGQSEENIRNLFKDAYEDKNEKYLHLIICDEFDALCKKRGSSHDSSGVSDNIVNQLLSMIDGPTPLNNVLLICMTNLKDAIDEAMLRPGRLEVQIGITLPNENGRQEILQIHTSTIKSNNILDQNINLKEIARLTKNYTGAELEGLVRNAISISIHENSDSPNCNLDEKFDKIKVTMSHFIRALNETKPMFGNSDSEINDINNNPFILWNKYLEAKHDEILKKIPTIKDGHNFVVLLSGQSNIGKTKFAYQIAYDSLINCIRAITPDNLITQTDRLSYIKRIFDQCSKVSESILIIDNFERLISYNKILRTFDNNMLQHFLILIKSITKDKSNIIIITACDVNLLNKLEMTDLVDYHVIMPNKMNQDEVRMILNDNAINDQLEKYDEYNVKDIMKLLKY